MEGADFFAILPWLSMFTITSTTDHMTIPYRNKICHKTRRGYVASVLIFGWLHISIYFSVLMVAVFASLLYPEETGYEEEPMQLARDLCRLFFEPAALACGGPLIWCSALPSCRVSLKLNHFRRGLCYQRSLDPGWCD